MQAPIGSTGLVSESRKGCTCRPVDGWFVDEVFVDCRRCQGKGRATRIVEETMHSDDGPEPAGPMWVASMTVSAVKKRKEGGRGGGSEEGEGFFFGLVEER